MKDRITDLARPFLPAKLLSPAAGRLMCLLSSAKVPNPDRRRILGMLQTANDLQRLAQIVSAAARPAVRADGRTAVAPSPEVRTLMEAVRPRLGLLTIL